MPPTMQKIIGNNMLRTMPVTIPAVRDSYSTFPIVKYNINMMRKPHRYFLGYVFFILNDEASIALEYKQFLMRY